MDHAFYDVEQEDIGHISNVFVKHKIVFRKIVFLKRVSRIGWVDQAVLSRRNDQWEK